LIVLRARSGVEKKALGRRLEEEKRTPKFVKPAFWGKFPLESVE
jgi:hypothetical protein